MRPDGREALLHPPLQRILGAWLEGLQKRGRVPGRTTIASYDEAAALQGLVGGKPLKPGTVSTRTIEARLANTPYSSIEQLLEIRFGKITTRPEARRQADAEWADAWARLQEAACRTAPADLCRRVFGWMEADRREFQRRFRRQGVASLERDLRRVVKALALLPEQGRFVLLAQLADEAAGDPHAFDAGESAGTLLDRSLAHWFREAAAQGRRGTARWRRRLLAAAGIQRDGISSRVDAFGLLLDSGVPLPPSTPALDEGWSLRRLIRVRGRLHAAHGVAWVVENATVFEALLDLLEPLEREFDPTLLCTHGNLRVAADVAIDELVANGARIFYSGDFDVGGLQIALEVKNRAPGRVDLWRMTPADYQSALRPSGRPIRWRSLPRLRAALPGLVAAMETAGRKASQEALIPALFEDIARFTRTRRASAITIRHG